MGADMEKVVATERKTVQFKKTVDVIEFNSEQNDDRNIFNPKLYYSSDELNTLRNNTNKLIRKLKKSRLYQDQFEYDYNAIENVMNHSDDKDCYDSGSIGTTILGIEIEIDPRRKNKKELHTKS